MSSAHTSSLLSIFSLPSFLTSAYIRVSEFGTFFHWKVENVYENIYGNLQNKLWNIPPWSYFEDIRCRKGVK